jgi:hypothetical protein
MIGIDRCLATTKVNMYKSLGHKTNLIFLGTAAWPFTT